MKPENGSLGTKKSFSAAMLAVPRWGDAAFPIMLADFAFADLLLYSSSFNVFMKAAEVGDREIGSDFLVLTSIETNNKDSFLST